MHVILGTPQPDAGPYLLDCQRASILYRFENGSQVYRKGMIKLIIANMGWTAQSGI